jgi:cytochrome c oxidase cbb3-type subunit 3
VSTTIRPVLPILLAFLCLTVPTHATNATVPNGAALYAQRCAACHGDDGAGGVGVPLSLPDFQATVDDAYLAKTIRLGRPGRVMPAFPDLDESQLQALVNHVRTLVPPASKTRAVTVRVRRGNATRGAKLYAQHCASCHGANGEGGHGTGVTFSRPRDYPILAPALHNPGFLAAASDAVIKGTLMHGRRGTPMRSFIAQGLKERDIDDLVAHVRSFERQPLPMKVPAEDEPAVIVRESPYDVEQTVDKIKTAIGAANFRLIRTGPFDKGFVPEGQENAQQIVVDSCDFGFLNEALKIDPRVGLFLPCRITVAKHGDKVLVMTMNPKRLSTIFNNRELDPLCERMQQIYIDLLEEATL